jgi:para-nitrobenzyl esterase
MGPQRVADFSNVMPEEFRQLGGLGFGVERPHQDEDCLVLNVWTPAADDARRPVMVWLHGSPFNSGSNSMGDGTSLARGGEVVVVMPNHRVGVLGFLHLDGVAAGRYPGAGNMGMLDLVMSLEWVRDNIAGFGGDPGNVTVFGCSGGGMKTSTLLAMPAAQGLFHKAIIESGPYVRAVPADRATTFTERFLAALGVDPSRIDELQRMRVDRLLDAQERVLQELRSEAIGFGDLGAPGPETFVRGVAHGGPLWDIGPTVDGTVLLEHPWDPAAPPSAAEVPLIIGLNRDEGALWLMMYPNANALSWEELESLAMSLRGDSGKEIVDLYRRTERGDPQDILDALISTDHMWIDSVHIAERKLAGGPAPVWMYQFAYRSDAVDGKLRAAHGLEVPFVFMDVGNAKITGTRPERFQVAEAMSTAWVSFARSGDPNHAGIPTWRPYTPDERTTLVFDAPCRVAADPIELREGLDALGLEFARPAITQRRS